jgi:hypothetical protein
MWNNPVICDDPTTWQCGGMRATSPVLRVPIRNNEGCRTRLFRKEALAITHATIVITATTHFIIFITSHVQHVLNHQLKIIRIRIWVWQFCTRDFIDMTR